MGVWKKTTEASPSTNQAVASQGMQTAELHKKAASHTKIVIRCNCGFPNNLFLRGEGLPGINWNKGVMLKCVKADEWVWESEAPFKNAKFKILLNDSQYEKGENHSIDCGKSIAFTPNF
jgi:hypothetical protein